MAKKDERNLNITINNKEDDENEVVISFSTLLKKLKRNLLLWIVAAVVLVAVAGGYAAVTTHTNKPPLEALVSFSYNGIEKGLDPTGRKFDVTTIKNPAVIESALTELDISLEELENIRKAITFEGKRPKDALDRLNVYNSILEQGSGGAISAAERILETSYYPTQFTVSFDYKVTKLTDNEAVAVFNAILDNYKEYFYENYGYNESLGNAVLSINYDEYDYAEAIDVFDNSLTTLKRYVKQLADEDETRFRSTETGYTFADLYEAVNTISGIDLDKISSYITVNNLTKDKEEALAYYEYRIKALTREKASLEEQLETYEKSIQAYEKDQIIVFGSTEDTNTQSSLASEQYDKMFGQKNSVATELANVKQQINFYKERQQALKSGSTASASMQEKVDQDLADLNVKVTNLVELVSNTSEDYYKNVTFKNAYNVLVPASYEASDKVSRVINNAKMPFVILEALGFAIFFGVSFIQSLVADNRKRKAALADGADDENDNEDDDKTEEK